MDQNLIFFSFFSAQILLLQCVSKECSHCDPLISECRCSLGKYTDRGNTRVHLFFFFLLFLPYEMGLLFFFFLGGGYKHVWNFRCELHYGSINILFYQNRKKRYQNITDYNTKSWNCKLIHILPPLPSLRISGHTICISYNICFIT